MASSMLSTFKDHQLLSSIVSANTDFAFDIYNELSKNSDGNIFFSPISISIALAMVYLGAKSNTAVEIKNGLRLSEISDQDIHSLYQEMTNFLQTDSSSSFILNTANRIFARKDYHFLDDFLDATKKFYHAEAMNLDFESDSEGSRKVINQWVEDQTAQKIKDLIPSGSVDSDTAMVLVNAIYFKGTWKAKFKKKETRPGKFKLGDGQEVDVDMMFRSDKMEYGQNEQLGCQIVEIPYVKEDLSFFVVLPDKEDGLTELVSKLHASTLSEMTSQMRKVNVNLTLPKFKLEDQFNLNQVLNTLGMKDMFIDGKADFSGIDGTQEMYVSSVVHKSYIEVNEKGSEAAATTAFTFTMLVSAPLIMEFKADHPFLFFIRDNCTKGILFMGRLNSIPTTTTTLSTMSPRCVLY